MHGSRTHRGPQSDPPTILKIEEPTGAHPFPRLRIPFDGKIDKELTFRLGLLLQEKSWNQGDDPRSKIKKTYGKQSAKDDAREYIREVMHTHANPCQADQNCPNYQDDADPVIPEQQHECAQHHCPGSVPGGERVGVGVTVNSSPGTFRAAAFDKEFNRKYQQRQNDYCNTDQYGQPAPLAAGEEPQKG